MTTITVDYIRKLPIDESYAVLTTTANGLDPDEATTRLAQVGANLLREQKGKPLYRKLLANFTHVMALLLWVGGVMAFVAQMPQLGIAIWAVNLINGAFSFWQEFKAEKATEALRQLLPHYAHVLRGGEEQRIPAETIVPGDLLLLSEGDRISADARLIEESELRVDQSTLTGESHAVRKTSEAVLSQQLSAAESSNIVFAGTNVAAGTGKALVFATGMATEFGKIAQLTQSVGDELSPLQKEMAYVTKIVTVIALGIGLLFFVLAVMMGAVSLAEGFIFAMGMIVAFVPEGLLPTVTLALAMGTQRMAKRHALIKRLSAVETLGCTSVICTDKTGTLTQNEMTVTNLWQAGQDYSVTGVGYTPNGQILQGGQVVDVATQSGLNDLLMGAALCNNARLLPPNGGTLPNGGINGENASWSILGDPTEAALLVAARKAGLDLDQVAERLPRLREIPFESRRKRMSTIHEGKDLSGAPVENCDGAKNFAGAPDRSSRIAFVKGAPKEVLSLCTRLGQGEVEVPLTDAERQAILDANDAYARNGLRVLAVAMRELACPKIFREGLVSRTTSVEVPFPEEAPGARMTAESVECDLTFLGLIAMMDPPRPEVAAAVAVCHRAGIRIVMITGDYGLTAESIARRIQIIRGGQPRIVTGVELDEMNEPALAEALQEEVIFARVAPEHKLRVVAALQILGHVVAVTGDGVNDAPALKKADIGVAMGMAGTDVAKESADMILTDDNFASIVNAVEEGRAVYANIKKFSTYVFTSNTPEAVPFIAFVLSGARIPLALNVMQILSIDLGTDIMPALALGAEAPEPGIMDRPPRNLNEHVITRGLLLRAYPLLGTVQSVAAMAAFYFQYWRNGYWGQWLDLPANGWLYQSATAMALGAVVATQIGNLFAQRTERTSFLRYPLFSNRLVWLGIASEVLLLLALVYLPPLHWIFGTATFAASNWLFLLAWLPSLLLVDEVRKYWARKTDKMTR